MGVGENMKIIKSVMLACGLAIVSSGALLWGGSVVGENLKKQEAETSGGVTRMTLDSYPSLIRTALVRKIITKKGVNETSPEEIRQYDLNFPGAPGYKNSKEWSIFEKNSKIDEFENNFHSVIQSVSDHGEYAITLSNRIDDLSTNQPELLFVLSNFKKSMCKSILKEVNNISRYDDVKIQTLEYAPNFSPLSEILTEKDIVTLPKNIHPSLGCIEAKGKYYYYQVIYEF